MGGSLFISMGDYAGLRARRGKEYARDGITSLGQGSWIRAQNGEGRAGSRCRVPKMETKVCERAGYAVEDFRMSLGWGDAWIRVPVRCYTECNTKPSYAAILAVDPSSSDLFN